MDWDERFRRALAEPAPSSPPAAWLVERCDLIAARAPGRAADLACGLGRHALFLAELGFEVDAIDASRVALDHLARAARARALPITTTRLDLRTLPALPRAPYAVVAVIDYLQRDLFGALIGALEPGGLLAVEAFVADPDPAWGPRNPDFVLAPGELEQLLGGTQVVFAEEAPQRGRIKARALAVR